MKLTINGTDNTAYTVDTTNGSITNAAGRSVTSDITVYNSTGSVVTDFSDVDSADDFIATTKATHGAMHITDLREAPQPVAPTEIVTFKTGAGEVELLTSEGSSTILPAHTSYDLELEHCDWFEIIAEEAPLASISAVDSITYKYISEI